MDDAVEAATKVRALQVIFLFCFSTRLWHYNLMRWGQLDFSQPKHVYYAVGAATATLALLVTLCSKRLVRLALGAALLIALWHVYLNVPRVGNHNYLELFVLLFFVALDPNESEDRRLLLVAARWLAVIVLFYAGLQKLIWGYYFEGQAFATYVQGIEWFRDGFRYILTETEFERITSYAFREGQGPFRFEEFFPLLLSNSVYLSELACGVLLVIPRTRLFAVFLSAGVLLGIEVFAHEVFFGTLQLTLVLLFAPASWIRRSVPFFAAFYGLLILSDAGVLPKVRFH